MSGLEVVPVRMRAARAFVTAVHRTHSAPPGGLFAVGAVDQAGDLRAVAIVGRPVARQLDDGRTAEVVRLASDGARNACSLLYAAAWRACRALGYRRLVTYTAAGETGASLRAAGWRVVGEAKPRRQGWHTPSRPRSSAAAPARLRWSPGVAP